MSNRIIVKNQIRRCTYMTPVGFSQRSRAQITESNIDSRRRKYPIHSEIITSTAHQTIHSVKFTIQENFTRTKKIYLTEITLQVKKKNNLSLVV